MDPQQLADKLASKVEYMLLQYHPRPTCVDKHKAHAEEVREIKRLLADRLNPAGLGLQINITV